MSSLHRCLSIFVVLCVGASVAHADTRWTNRNRTNASIRRRTEDEWRKQEQAEQLRRARAEKIAKDVRDAADRELAQGRSRTMEEQRRVKQNDDSRVSKLGKLQSRSRNESPFSRTSRVEAGWSNRNPWTNATHPSKANPGVGLWTRTNTERRSIVSQLSHGQTGVSSVHQMLIRRAVALGPHFDFVHRSEGSSSMDNSDELRRNRPSLFAALR